MDKVLRTIITDIEFDNDVTIPDISNPTAMLAYINNNQELDLTALQAYYNENYVEKEATVSREDIKAVFQMLKDRELHPVGTFDKAGRFYLRDSELVDVRSPSAKYPYSQMNAGRTAKFVKAIAEKYKCSDKAALIACFSNKN